MSAMWCTGPGMGVVVCLASRARRELTVWIVWVVEVVDPV